MRFLNEPSYLIIEVSTRTVGSSKYQHSLKLPVDLASIKCMPSYLACIFNKSVLKEARLAPPTSVSDSMNQITHWKNLFVSN